LKYATDESAKYVKRAEDALTTARVAGSSDSTDALKRALVYAVLAVATRQYK